MMAAVFLETETSHDTFHFISRLPLVGPFRNQFTANLILNLVVRKIVESLQPYA